MRKICKKLITVVLALTLIVSVFSFAGCWSVGTLNGVKDEDVVTSNGGFAVQSGDYVYFINGKEESTAENQYGDVVKASLQRISKADMMNNDYTKLETVVPLLMVAADYSSGVYIYNNVVYYATPTSAKNISGKTENTYLDFKSTDLKTGKTMDDFYFRSSDNKTSYRFVEVDDVVYCMHVVDGSLYSYNTKTKKDNILVKSYASIQFDKNNVENPYVYYTMSVSVDIDSDIPDAKNYNQIYRVKADATYTNLEYNKENGINYVEYQTQSGHKYRLNADYMKKKAEDEKADKDSSKKDDTTLYTFDKNDVSTFLYVNLGELVLDGRGFQEKWNQFSAENTKETNSLSARGYVYTLSSYANGGIYYSRKKVESSSSTGDGGELYYLAEEMFSTNGKVSDTWNSISDNAKIELNGTEATVVNGKKEGKYLHQIVAFDTTTASSSALFYMTGETQHYLYIEGTTMHRITVAENGSVAEDVLIARNVSGTFLYLDNTYYNQEANTGYGYVYYTVTGDNGSTINRLCYTGTQDQYNTIRNEDIDDYLPQSILDVNYTADWYAPELYTFTENNQIHQYLLFTDARSFGEKAYNYVAVMDLSKEKTNTELKALNEKYNDLQKYLGEIGSKDSGVATAISYYYYTGESALFDFVIEQAQSYGKTSTYLYSKVQQDVFNCYVKGEKYGDGKDYDFTQFVDEDGVSYRTLSYFYHSMRVLSKEDNNAIGYHEDYKDKDFLTGSVWRESFLSHYTEEESLAVWQWVLIGIAIGVGVIGIACGITIPLVIHFRKKKRNVPKQNKRKIVIDTTDDKNIDVYATEEGEKDLSTMQEVEEEEGTQEPTTEGENQPSDTEENK